jgi:hypothetical protein
MLNDTKYGVADCGMKTIVLCGENPCRDVKFYVSTSKIHTSTQQRPKYIFFFLNAVMPAVGYA